MEVPDQVGLLPSPEPVTCRSTVSSLLSDADPAQIPSLVSSPGVLYCPKPTQFVIIDPAGRKEDVFHVVSETTQAKLVPAPQIPVSGDQTPIVSSFSCTQSEKASCRICQEDDTCETLASPCFCTGTVGFMHLSCLEKWLRMNGRTQCELCSFPFPVEKSWPTIWEHLKQPTKNMDFSSLLCDVSCFFLLTPLLMASTYLCSLGVNHYSEVGKTESVFAIVTLMVSLIAVYLAWASLAFVYHRRVWLAWREKNVQIRLWTDTGSPLCLAKDVDDSVSSDAIQASRLAGPARRLLPILPCAGFRRPNIHNSVAIINILADTESSRG